MVGEPYQPEDLPIPDYSEEEEDTSEEGDSSEEEVKNMEEYEPLEVIDSDKEYMLQDAQMDEDPAESSTVRASPIVTPPPSSPPRIPRCPLAIGVQQKSPLHETAWFTEALSQRRNADLSGHFEPGKSSQAPQPDHPISRDDGLANRVHQLEEILRAKNAAFEAFEQRLKRLEEKERSDTEVNAMGAHCQALEYRAQIAESQSDASKYYICMVEQRADIAEQRENVAEQGRRQLQERYDDLVRLMGTQFGK